MPVSVLLTWRYIFLSLFLTTVLSTNISYAGECVNEDEDLYNEVISYFTDGKRGAAEDYYVELHCWRGDPRYDHKLRTFLKNVILDSRIHPAYVANAINAYGSVSSDADKLMNEVKKNQGNYRYGIISALLNQDDKKLGALLANKATIFPNDIDFIDGPAKVRSEPKGKIVAFLPDNTKIRLLQQKEKWVEVQADEVKGWVLHENLMGRTINSLDPSGFSVLSRAAFMGYPETVHYLLRQGADVNFVDNFGRNAVHWAVEGGFTHLGGLEIETLKAICARKDIDVNLPDKEGNTPLLLAIDHGRLDMIKILLDKENIDVNVPGKRGETPLIKAVQLNDEKIVAVLLSMKNIRLDDVDAQGESALYEAVRQGNLPLVQLLLNRNAKADTVTKEGKTLYHAALGKDYYSTYRYPNIEIIKILVAHPEIDINKADSKGYTPLFLAIDAGREDVVKILLTVKKLDVNGKMDRKYSYLSLAFNRSSKLANLLLDREETDVNVELDGNSIAHMAWHSPAMGSDGVEMAKKILAKEPDLEVTNGQGETPLVYNINRDNVEMVRLLASQKWCGLDRANSYGKTPLVIAKSRGNGEIVDILVKAGAHEYKLIGDGDKSPEGIPQALLENEAADQAIRFYRGYLVMRTEETLEKVRAGSLDDAIHLQEFILDELLIEVGESMPKYSGSQRKLVREIFATIKEHYARYPRAKSKWYQSISEEQKAAYAKVDALLSDVLAGKYDALPDGELTTHTPMVPILILRGYMANNSIKTLTVIRKGKTGEAVQLMTDVLRQVKVANYERLGENR